MKLLLQTELYESVRGHRAFTVTITRDLRDGERCTYLIEEMVGGKLKLCFHASASSKESARKLSVRTIDGIVQRTDVVLEHSELP